jgi:glycosyltransferase 2 family protein
MAPEVQAPKEPVPAAEAGQSPEATPSWKVWLKRLQPLLGLGLLVFVASMLDWRDRLILRPGAGAEKVARQGTIQGDWRSDQAVFVPDSAGRGEWPASIELARLTDGSWQATNWQPEGALELSPGMPRVLASVEPQGLLLALTCFILALKCGITRWWRLLRATGAAVRWRDTFRLTYLGLFFNLVVPGLTGGDVVKAVLAVREHPRQRADALVSVVVDRIFGMYMLVVLAAVILLIFRERFPGYAGPFILLAAGLTAGALLYSNPALRRRLRIDALLAKLPLGKQIEKLDRAALLYLHRPGEVALALLLSVGNHFWTILGVIFLARAFGVSAEAIPNLEFAAIVPLTNMASAIPTGPAGLGIGEAAYAYLFQLLGVSAALGVAVSLGFRVCQLTLSIIGGLFLLTPKRRAELKAVEQDLAQTSP